MARFVTPAGVVIELAEKAARAVGYKPVAEKPAPTKRPRKPDAESDEK